MARCNQVKITDMISEKRLGDDSPNALKLKSLLVVICLIAFTGVSSFATEKDYLWEKRSNAQVDWQIGLANLLLNENPEEKELIQMQLDLQINYIRIRNEKYYYLLKNNPSRLDRDNGHLQWANFEWTENDEFNLLKLNDEYEKLKYEHELLNSKNAGHLSLTKVRESFISIQEQDNYQELYKKLKNTFIEIDQELAR